jgi:hypothetical protein
MRVRQSAEMDKRQNKLKKIVIQESSNILAITIVKIILFYLRIK